MELNLKLKNSPEGTCDIIILEKRVLKPNALMRKMLTFGLAPTSDDDYEVESSTKIRGKMNLPPVEFTCDKNSYDFLLKQQLNYSNYSISFSSENKIKELEVEFDNKKYLLKGIIVVELSCNDIDITLDEKEYSGVLCYDDIKRIY